MMNEPEVRLTPLAVFAPNIGVPSETFIRRHMNELMPGKTSVIAYNADYPVAGRWTASGVSLVLNREALLRNSSSSSIDAVLTKFLTQHGVKVLMGEYLDHSLHFLGLCRQLGIRFYGHGHGYDVFRNARDPKWRDLYTRYNESDGVIVVSSAAKSRLHELGIGTKRLHVVPCGVDLPLLPIVHLDKRSVHCVTVGRMVAKKGPILTLDAFRRAWERWPDLRLNMIGDGPLLAAVQQFIIAFGLSNCVTLYGEVAHPEVLRIMSASDIFLQHNIEDASTGDQEGLPVALLEAMACGLAVIATRHAGIPDAVIDGENGYLVNEGDSIAMAERVLALTQSAAHRNRLGRMAVETVKERFSWKQEREHLLDLMRLTS